MPRLNDSVNTPVNADWKQLLMETAARCPGKPSHTRLMRYLAQWALPLLIDKLDASRPVSQMLEQTDEAADQLAAGK